MITRIQALNFRCLQYIDQRVANFHALIGPNASGKTTFLDILAFVRDLVLPRNDLEIAIQNRTRNFRDLLWKHQGDCFELALEAEVPDEIIRNAGFVNGGGHKHIRYELIIRETEIFFEALSFIGGDSGEKNSVQQLIFPQENIFPPQTLLIRKGRKLILKKQKGRNNNYYPETEKGYKPSLINRPIDSALANIPNEQYFPVAIWFRNLIQNGVKNLMLDSVRMRQPSRPGQTLQFDSGGANLPWVVEKLTKEKRDLFNRWIEHIRVSLPDIKNMDVMEREEDRHKYLKIEYDTGVKVPSWFLSDGTLRMLALTLLAYLREGHNMYLIEEPENGMHPLAVESVLDSLKSIYDSQVLIATHSLVALNTLEPKDILCFAKNENGAADVVSGDKHPALRDYKAGYSDSLGMIFASGILGRY